MARLTEAKTTEKCRKHGNNDRTLYDSRGSVQRLLRQQDGGGSCHRGPPSGIHRHFTAVYQSCGTVPLTMCR